MWEKLMFTAGVVAISLTGFMVGKPASASEGLRPRSEVLESKIVAVSDCRLIRGSSNGVTLNYAASFGVSRQTKKRIWLEDQNHNLVPGSLETIVEKRAERVTTQYEYGMSGAATEECESLRAPYVLELTPCSESDEE